MEEFFAPFTPHRHPRRVEWLRRYQLIFRFGATLLSLCTLLSILGLFIGSRRSRAGVILFGVSGFVLLLPKRSWGHISVATRCRLPARWGRRPASSCGTCSKWNGLGGRSPAAPPPRDPAAQAWVRGRSPTRDVASRAPRRQGGADDGLLAKLRQGGCDPITIGDDELTLSRELSGRGMESVTVVAHPV
jgi:hypothetical protein